MLQLKNIKKTYISGDEKVEALKGIDIEFRESEFVSILGQSGCGKTTLLNIIGGLDRYTDGDLIINGKSTKDFKDRDWDSYRNYRVGFVFQSYNLISHQSVLANVELALTIGGVSKKERRQRAIKALEEVGLKDQINKKPNQLSGGQMQRVAIARALVNDPDIILADEPTGALDTKTSVQVMELLKKISKNKLIIMVTHNPDLAEKYSNRIIKILDGKIIDDSSPVENTEKDEKKLEKDILKRTSMKFFTAFRLSLNNLMTKKGRTILTSFAGSIGIIGIALILAISTGVQNYIDKVEEDTLSSYPITIEKSTIDFSGMLETLMGENSSGSGESRDENRIYSSSIVNEVMETMSSKAKENNLEDFKKYLEKDGNEIVKYTNAISYGYNLKLNLYKTDYEDEVVRVNPSTMMDAMGMGDMMEARNSSSMMSFSGSASSLMMNSQTDVWYEMLDNEDLVKSQNDLLAGKWPDKYNEVVLIVNENNEVSDYTLYTLGLMDQKEIRAKMKKLQNGKEIEKTEQTSYSYEDMLNLSYKLVLTPDLYAKENGVWIDKSDDNDYLKEKLDDAEVIKVVGIIRPNSNNVANTVNSYGGIGYKTELKEYVIKKSNESEIVKEQKSKPETNVLSGMPFPTETDFSVFNMANLSMEQKMAMANMQTEDIAKLVNAFSQNENATYENNLEKIGAVDLECPATVNLYPKDFNSKDKIQELIADYNKEQQDNGKEENVLNYTDIIGTMMKSVSKIINTISYVLIAFVAISLVVSSIMIGIITYISVLERTKEIGILRAIGASKKDISRVFNAETLIVGLIAGLLGIGITVLLTFPINSVILKLTGVEITTVVPAVAGVSLVIISVLLTIVGGLIPSKLASKKDPVIALRTE